MYFGMPHSAGLGHFHNHVMWQHVLTAGDGSSFEYTIFPSTGLGDAWYGIYVNGTHVDTVWLAEGEATTVSCPLPWGTRSYSYLAMRHGHSADQTYVVNDQARFVEEIWGNKSVTLEFTYVPEFIGDIGDTAGLSSWSFSGLSQGVNCGYVQGFPSRGRLVADLVVSGATATLTLKNGNTNVASGTATISGPTTLTFSELNSSGLSGSVLVSATATSLSGISVYVRWPREMVVYRGVVDPPASEVARIRFSGANTVRWTEPSDLASTTYYYRLRPNSDTDDLGTWTGSMGINLDTLPAPPSYLRYISGDVSNTILGYSGSATVGATYRLYAQSMPGETMDMSVPDASVGAGVLQVGLPLDHITGFSGTVDGFSGFSGFSGQIFALVRAVHPTTGLEEQNMDGILLEYDQFGRHVARRPNPARLNPLSVSVTGGLSAGIEATYDDTREDGTATLLRLYARSEFGTYDFNSHVDSQSIVDDKFGVRYADLTYLAPAPGFYYLKALAWTAEDGRSRDDLCNEVLVYVSDVDMPAVSGFSAYASRG